MTLFDSVHEWLWEAYFKVLALLYSACKIQKNKIVITSYYGADYGDNGKYIVEEIRRRNMDVDIVWLLKDHLVANNRLPEGVRGVKYRSRQSVYELETAGVWLDNSRKTYGRKRKGQYYIQTWHGDIGMKRIEKDVEHALSAKYVRNAQNDSKMIDIMLSGNAWFTRKIHEIFWYDGPVLECGYPRRDILYRQQAQTAQMKDQMGLPADSKVLFYAPTFRKEQEKLGVTPFALDWDRVLTAAQERFGGQWIGMIRLHPNIAHMSELLQLPENVYDMTHYPDMQELLAVSDICLSDYSSSVFEFAVTGKPAFIFATDVDEYREDRGTHFQFDELPYPMAQDMDTLISSIAAFDDVAYKLKSKQFYENTLGMYKEGHASACVADIIAGICFKGMQE